MCALMLLRCAISLTIFDYSVLDSQNNSVPLSKFASARVIIIVNTATKDLNFKKHIRELVEIYDEYQKDGLEILAFPCNQFGSMEPGSEVETQEAMLAAGVGFPVFAKVNVHGRSAIPLFKFLIDRTGMRMQCDGLRLRYNVTV